MILGFSKFFDFFFPSAKITGQAVTMGLRDTGHAVTMGLRDFGLACSAEEPVGPLDLLYKRRQVLIR